MYNNQLTRYKWFKIYSLLFDYIYCKNRIIQFLISLVSTIICTELQSLFIIFFNKTHTSARTVHLYKHNTICLRHSQLASRLSELRLAGLHGHGPRLLDANVLAVPSTAIFSADGCNTLTKVSQSVTTQMWLRLVAEMLAPNNLGAQPGKPKF